jgi:anti-sigma factor RsiW
MNQCWSPGDLRAHIDGELAPQEAAHLEEHLKTCESCGALLSELATRAGRVDRWISELEPAVAKPMDRPRFDTRRAVKYAGGALALAAGLAIGFLTMPKRENVRPIAIAPPAVAPMVQEPVVAAETPVPAPVRARRPAVNAAYYVPLDDEPFETGTIMRVGLPDSKLEAELILGPDGRAHAIRMVSVK